MSERREWWINPETMKLYATNAYDLHGDSRRIHVREVLPGDDVPQKEWTDVVIELQQARSQLAELREAAKHVLMVNVPNQKGYTYGLDNLRNALALAESEGDDDVG